MSLRELVESDLAQTLENSTEWGQSVILIGPDGIEQNTSANDNTKPLTGRVEYNTSNRTQRLATRLL